MKRNSFQSFAFLIPDSGGIATAGRRLRSPDSQARVRSRSIKQARRARIVNNTFHKPETSDINQEQFDRLLGWLDSDWEKAGAEYERIRRGLIKNFVSRGSLTPEDLADKTINRVAGKVSEIQATYVGDPAHYFSSVAGYIFLETLRKEKVPAVGMPGPAPRTTDDEMDHANLEICVAKLPASDRDLLLAYYQHERHEKIEHRRKLAARFGLGMNALRIRACRIRLRLHENIEQRRAAGERTIRTQAAI